MSKYIRRVFAPLVLSLAVLVGACADRDDDQGDTTLAGDTALNRDLALAGQDTAAQPQLSDVPASSGTKSPAATRPRSTGGTTNRPSGTSNRPSTTPSGNVRERGTGAGERTATLPAGTVISLAANERVCTNTHKAGDRFAARVTESVTAGDVTIPAGATAVVRVTSVSSSGNVNEPVRMGLLVDRITLPDNRSFPVDASITEVKVEQTRTSSRGDDAKKVAAGAVAGAILGQILGKDTKSTVIGAATGAAAGTAVAVATGDYAGCVPQGGRIAIRLNSPATVAAGE